MLREAFAHLKRKAAPGIDGMVHAEYAENLDERLAELEKRLKEGRYRATCVKRHWIAKPGSNKMRPLGIPVLEDKIVQQAVKMLLEAIWEADFHDESIEYRGGVGARQSSRDLAEALYNGTYRWVVEADIRSFFDHIDHDWMVRMLDTRIADRPLIRLIVKWLKAGGLRLALEGMVAVLICFIFFVVDEIAEFLRQGVELVRGTVTNDILQADARDDGALVRREGIGHLRVFRCEDHSFW